MSQKRRDSLSEYVGPATGLSGFSSVGKLIRLNHKQFSKLLIGGKHYRRLNSVFWRRVLRLSKPDTGPKGDIVTEEWPLILVTGANGYIGSHVVLEILKQGRFGVVAIDSLANSSLESLRRVRLLANQTGIRRPPLFFYQTDIRDRAGLEMVFGRYRLSNGRSAIRHVIHFAALKSVDGSRLDPAGYYSTNVTGTAGLLGVMEAAGVRSIVFSSSAVVYGARAGPGAESVGELLTESACPVRAGQPEAERLANYARVTNPYGKTKLMCEELIHELCHANNPLNQPGLSFRAVILRYTNPSGNDPSGLIGDSPVQAENLMPIAAQVLQGTREHISIYGADYPTPDGTGIRDFIHVQDLAKGHLAALNVFGDQVSGQVYPDNCQTYNLGTGKGASVLEVIQALMDVSGRAIKTKLAPRRAGDLAVVVCDPSKAERELGWRAERNVVERTVDADMSEGSFVLLFSCNIFLGLINRFLGWQKNQIVNVSGEGSLEFLHQKPKWATIPGDPASQQGSA